MTEHGKKFYQYFVKHGFYIYHYWIWHKPPYLYCLWIFIRRINSNCNQLKVFFFKLIKLKIKTNKQWFGH